MAVFLSNLEAPANTGFLRNILIISHDRVDFREDARMKNNLHFDLLLLILLSKAPKEMLKEGLASSSESLRLASASPLSGSENNAGRESKIWRANVALCGSGSSSASFSTDTSVFMEEFWQDLRELRFISASRVTHSRSPVAGLLPTSEARAGDTCLGSVWSESAHLIILALSERISFSPPLLNLAMARVTLLRCPMSNHSRIHSCPTIMRSFVSHARACFRLKCPGMQISIMMRCSDPKRKIGRHKLQKAAATIRFPAPPG